MILNRGGWCDPHRNGHRPVVDQVHLHVGRKLAGSHLGVQLAGLGRRLYDYAVAQARKLHPEVATGQFAADMQVHLVNDGPVTIPLRMPPAVN